MLLAYIETSDIDDIRSLNSEVDHNLIRINMFGATKSFKIPALFQPRIIEILTKSGSSYFKVLQKRFGFSYLDNTLIVRFGQQNNDWVKDDPDKLNSKVWIKELPWHAKEFLDYTVYNTNSSIFKIYNSHQSNDGEFPSEVFLVKDADGEVVKATCYDAQARWTQGTGMFKWLRIFFPNTVKNFIEISFSSETGSRKGSWKGGVTGASINKLTKDESIKSALTRYCREHGMTISSGFAEEVPSKVPVDYDYDWSTSNPKFNGIK